MGVPTGPHGAFRDYQVDAITLEISPKVSLTKLYRRNEFILRGGRYVPHMRVALYNYFENQPSKNLLAVDEIVVSLTCFSF